MKKGMLPLILAALSSSIITATNLKVIINNNYPDAKAVKVELYEAIERTMLPLDVEAAQPEWEWQIKVKKNKTATKTKAVNSPGNYQLSAYVKDRKEPLGNPYNFTIKKKEEEKEISLEITENGDLTLIGGTEEESEEGEDAPISPDDTEKIALRAHMNNKY